MALEGTFGDFGLAEIFQLIGLQKKTGVLSVKGTDESLVVTVSFDKGMVTFADEYQRGEKEKLGNILLRSQLISKEQLERAVQTQKETLQKLGHVLIQMGFISQETLRQALQTQVKETVYRLFRWKSGSYHFSSEPVAYDKDMYTPIAAELLLMDGVRMIDEWPVIEKKIGSLSLVYEKNPEKRPLLPGEEASGAASEDGGEAPRLSPQEAGIYGLLDGVRTVQQVIDVGKIGEFETCKILYGFLSLGLIVQVQEAIPAGAPPAVARRSAFPIRDIIGVAVTIFVFLGALLFNPWSYFTLRYNVAQSRKEIGGLIDELKIERLRHALQIFYLEKQSYPYELEKLVEDEMLSEEDIENNGARPFVYGGGDKDYQISRE